MTNDDDVKEVVSGEEMTPLPEVKKSFSELGLSKWLCDQLRGVSVTRPTPVQTACLPEILAGRDVMACAQTGSGKTAAFALPILQKLAEDPYGIFALILTPTRELAFQIAEQFRILGKPMNLRDVVVTGGRNMMLQSLDLAKRPHIVIATPGRLADQLASTDTFNLDKIKFLVLDEADRLLEDNFGQQLSAIFAKLPSKRQTLLFSATLTDTLENLPGLGGKPFIWSATNVIDETSNQQVSNIPKTVATLTQQFLLTPAHVKDAFMVYMIDHFLSESPHSNVLIFTNVCKYCQILGMTMRRLGFDIVVLHSVLTQRQRLASLAKFKSSQTRVMIATDVASRGLDIPAVDLVINHNVPTRPKDYVHRVGRTARAGRRGRAVTLVTQFDVSLIQACEKHVGAKLTPLQVNESAVASIVAEVALARREAEIQLDETDFGEARERNTEKRKRQEKEEERMGGKYGQFGDFFQQEEVKDDQADRKPRGQTIMEYDQSKSEHDDEGKKSSKKAKKPKNTPTIDSKTKATSTISKKKSKKSSISTV